MTVDHVRSLESLSLFVLLNYRDLGFVDVVDCNDRDK